MHPNQPKPAVEMRPVVVPQNDGTFVIYPGKPVVVGDEVTAAEAAKLLGVSPRTIARQCETGQFKTAIKPGGTLRSLWKILRSEVEGRRRPPAD